MIGARDLGRVGASPSALASPVGLPAWAAAPLRCLPGTAPRRSRGTMGTQRRKLTIQKATPSAPGSGYTTRAEDFTQELAAEESEAERLESEARQILADLAVAEETVEKLGSELDALFAAVLGETSLEGTGLDGDAPGPAFAGITEAMFTSLARDRAPDAEALLRLSEERVGPAQWRTFQAQTQDIKLRKTRAEQEVASLRGRLADLRRAQSAQAATSSARERAEGAGAASTATLAPRVGDRVRIVMITGFESFNNGLYQDVARQLSLVCPQAELLVFSDRDIKGRPDALERALAKADVFFASLVFDFDEVEWLRARVQRVPLRFCFESALELMQVTQVGSFAMGAPDPGKRSGPPPIVRKVLGLFGSQREEDKLVGYLSFLKIGPKLLRFIPGGKARDLRNWLQVYAYWNQGGSQNVLSMALYLLQEYFGMQGAKPTAVVETPAVGCLHPDHEGYFQSPLEYMTWYRREGPLRHNRDAPVAAVLLYRKHVITEQPYIRQLIRAMEENGIVPVPVFINGVEAHTVVRDLLTTEHEQQGIQAGTVPRNPTVRRDAIKVDAVVSTIGFPLVGGPAGAPLEGGRQSEVAKEILAAKNVPYFVAAPLLIQDMRSWARDGVAGLQSVVLYALPELDGAIDTVPIGGLLGNNIFLSPERVGRLCARIRNWVSLRRKGPADRRVAMLLYGFPPGVGAVGTAALLNVPESLERVLAALRDEGYDLGGLGGDLAGVGEHIVAALRAQMEARAVNAGKEAVEAAGAAAAGEGVRCVCREVSAKELRAMLSFPADWGPDQWGPLPYLPDSDVLVRRMERQWGDLDKYRGIMTTARGTLVVAGVQIGNVFIGVQPLLGIEGDPMRLLFERDLTPHPQYAAFYRWLEQECRADCLVHFGMHGTVEWLPGSPLGNTGLSWSDVLMGSLPNAYVYACNNPSESIVAKRRGYGTIVSHNVPPYGRAGLYKQLGELRSLLQEFRENPTRGDVLRQPIAQQLQQAGLASDVPFRNSDGDPMDLTVDNVGEISDEAFEAYVAEVYAYLQVVENRLFSEGLHVLGRAPSPPQMRQYLDAYFSGSLPDAVIDAVADPPDLEAARAMLERCWAEEPGLRFRKAGATGNGAGDQAGVSVEERAKEALEIRSLLERNSEEIAGLLRALRGEWVPPEAGGDLLRDGAGVLPTGRNIHALDPYRMPSKAAFERGAQIRAAILAQHDTPPETVAVNLWGLDAIKTKGESVGIVLHLVGARPVQESTGRVARYELIPLEELGRPRVDVLCNMSGIFRDSFQNVVELLDDMFQRAASADEPIEMNFIKKHAMEMGAKGLKNTAARLFSNPAGDYGSMVNERVGSSDWSDGGELGETWASRNAFSYGRGGEKGTARPEVLRALLGTTERVVQEIDSVEYGLTDIQEYYANTGALKRAAENARPGKGVQCSVVESFGKDVRPRDLEEVLRLEYRSKFLNPKWAQAMASQGSGGAYEISQRMTALLGWGATTEFKENWVWDQAAETYALDEEMRERLRKANPEAFANVLRRMLEAAGRGMWQADPDTLDRLRELYSEMDDELEGVVVAPASSSASAPAPAAAKKA